LSLIALEKVVVHQLEPHFRPKAMAPDRFSSLNPVIEECQVLLSALAHLSHTNAGQVA
tara:strand:- start:6326 stop:6499 length:174 start_codon:yes stop_codon:yes gene_type:complete